ncbi:MAG TPA: DeoR family transcriptional regulator [Bacillales bacterium]|nr:DeoR family transcriptional regulator [Bacillales bacterium]
MLAIERRQRIRELVLARQNMKISELSRLLDVSEMTIHRDIKPLMDEGLIMKTFGGITLVRQNEESVGMNGCVICSREIQDKFSYRLIFKDQRIETACCPHCGILRHHQMETEVLQAICRDFLTETTISAEMGWYVLNSELQVGCCQPQILTFKWKEHAEKFVKGFGGAVLSFHETKEKMKEENRHYLTD